MTTQTAVPPTSPDFKPLPVSKPESVFGASDMGRMMPSYAEIPKEFKDHSNKWNQFVSRWFFNGLNGQSFKMKEGISGKEAFAHMGAIMCSFEPKHEHKTAGVAYLCSLWIDEIIPAKG